MAYSLPDTVLGLLPGLPQSGAGYTATVTLIGSHITRADSIIDSYCARRYEVPFAATSTSTPPMITTLSQDMASYYTYRSKFTGDNANKFDYLNELMLLAMDTLKAIQEGRVDVVGVTGTLVDERGGSDKVWSSTESFTPLFDVDDELNWQFPQDRLDSIRSDRQ